MFSDNFLFLDSDCVTLFVLLLILFCCVFFVEELVCLEELEWLLAAFSSTSFAAVNGRCLRSCCLPGFGVLARYCNKNTVNLENCNDGTTANIL